MSNPTGKGGFRERPAAINRKGRPKSFDQLRALAQKLSHESIKPGESMTAVEAILRKLAMENPERFLEIAYGKVPQPVDVTSGGEKIKAYIGFSPDDWDKDEQK